MGMLFFARRAKTTYIGLSLAYDFQFQVYLFRPAGEKDTLLPLATTAFT